MDHFEQYPDISWGAFAYFNQDADSQFENMCRQLFQMEYLKENNVLHSNPNNPGIETKPLYNYYDEEKGKSGKISFQTKYFTGKIQYGQIYHSLEMSIEKYGDQLDFICLYCNKPINDQSNCFIKIKKMLEDSGIDIILITDQAILDLVRKYQFIADYYFRPRKLYDFSEMINSKENITITVTDNSNAAIGTISYVNNKFIEQLISDKIEQFKIECINLNLKLLKTELDELFENNDIEGLKEKDTLYYYRFLLALHAKDDAQENQYVMLAGEKYSYDISILKNFRINPREISSFEFTHLFSESQVVLLDMLLTEGFWDNILLFRSDLNDHEGVVAPDVFRQLDFYGALAYFNKRNYYQAREILQVIVDSDPSPKNKFFMLCASILGGSDDLEHGDMEQLKILPGLLKELSAIKLDAPEIVQLNEVVVAYTEVQTYCQLAQYDKAFAQDAFTCYDTYSENTQQLENIKYFIALCHEFEGDVDIALDFYTTLGWTKNPVFAVRLLMCLIQKGRVDEALSYYDRVDKKRMDSRVDGVYLYALSLKDIERYCSELDKKANVYYDDPTALFFISLYINDKKIFEKHIVPIANVVFSYRGNIEILDSKIKSGWLELFANFDQITLLRTVLETIDCLNTIDLSISREIYNALFRVLKKDLGKQFFANDVQKILISAEWIANKYLSSGILYKEFLQIQIMRSDLANAPLSMLKYAKELFECDKNEVNARNVIALLTELKEAEREEYEPYLELLYKSSDPMDAMAIAAACLETGHSEEANLYAYKAIYLLNGKEDYNVYRSFFRVHARNLKYNPPATTCEMVGDNTVVTLCGGNQADVLLEEKEKIDSHTRIICLDAETEFSDRTNHSLGIEHVCRGNWLYSKLIGLVIGQTLDMDNQTYTVIKIEPRASFAVRFLCQILQEHPEEFKEDFTLLSSANPDELMEQLKLLMGDANSFKEQLQFYHFENNMIGLPIDSLIRGNYDKYIAVVRYLLLQKGEALYAGSCAPAELHGNYYVPALSTLVILGLLDLFQVFQGIDDKIMVPESYIKFFESQFADAKARQPHEKGELVPLENGNIVMLEPDTTIMEIWEKLLLRCQRYKRIPVYDEESISITLDNNIKLEELFGSFNLCRIHLDSFALAIKEKAIYICDDLFMRNIANLLQIQNINFASLLYHYLDPNFTVPILLELSKTNYVFMPFFVRDNEDRDEILNNLLNGGRKEKLYRSYFDSQADLIQRNLYDNDKEE